MSKSRYVTFELGGTHFRLTKPEARALIGRMSVQMRDVYSGGPGRPRTVERCPCGAMSIVRAAKRGHKCEAVTA